MQDSLLNQINNLFLFSSIIYNITYDMLYNMYTISPNILPKILFVCLIRCIMMLFYRNKKAVFSNYCKKTIFVMIIIIHIDKRISLYVIAPHAKTMPFSSIYFFCSCRHYSYCCHKYRTYI